MSLLTMLFLGLCALIIVCQLIPATILFIGIVKGLFSARKVKEIKS